MFCAAPAITAANRGVVPNKSSNGWKKSPNKISEKKSPPVRNKTLGVTNAATPHPNFWKINLPSIIINNVIVPVAVEKFPMKAE
mmetsp:Transcript_11231/g.14586  ORF Transcript_11231/g.14586 Transcript_11231/m.14586 type:complete len:84 (+) Transcript_11231:763-1014(+)